MVGYVYQKIHCLYSQNVLRQGVYWIFSCVSIITFFCKNDKQNANKFTENYNWAFVDKLTKKLFFLLWKTNFPSMDYDMLSLPRPADPHAEGGPRAPGSGWQGSGRSPRGGGQGHRAPGDSPAPAPGQGQAQAAQEARVEQKRGEGKSASLIIKAVKFSFILLEFVPR